MTFSRDSRDAAQRFLRRHFGELLTRARDAHLDQVAGSLTFTTLLALVPMITLVLALFAAFPAFDEFKGGLEDYLADSFLPDEAGAAIMSHISDFAANAGRMTAAGLTVLALTAYFLMQTIDRAFSAIWRVRRSRSVARRIALYCTAAVAGPLVIGASLAGTAFLISTATGLLPALIGLDKFLLGAVPVGMTALAITVLYKVAPSCLVRWRHAMAGGMFAALGFELMKTLFALYLAAFPSYQIIYGAFAAFPIFLLWIYLSWIVTLLGALLAAMQAPPAEDMMIQPMA